MSSAKITSRSKEVNVLLRSLSLPKTCQSHIVTRSLLTKSVIHKEISKPLRTKTLDTNFFSPLPRRPTSNIIQLLQNRTYAKLNRDSVRNNYYYKKQEQEAAIKEFFGNVVIGIIAITCTTVTAIYLHTIKIPGFITSRYPSLRDIDKFMGENFVLTKYNLHMGRWWTYITSTFNHASLLHWGLNIFALVSFGTQIVRVTGPSRLVILYVVGTIAGSYSSLNWGVEKPPNVNYLGASGGVCAMASFLATVLPKLQYTFIFMPWVGIPAWAMMAFFAGFSWVADANGLVEGVGHMGHLGGVTAGGVLGLIFRIASRRL